MKQIFVHRSIQQIEYMIGVVWMMAFWKNDVQFTHLIQGARSELMRLADRDRPDLLCIRDRSSDGDAQYQ